jgi:hypothetical protein
MARPTRRTKAMVTEIIERVSEGQTLTSICRDEHLPCLRSLMNWLSADDALDNRMHRARIRGTLIQADEAVDAQRAVINGTAAHDPKHLQAIVTAANNLGHQASAKLSKIDNRYKDKQEVEHTGPMIIGWEEPEVAGPKMTGAAAVKVVADEFLDAITLEDVPN